MKINDKVVVITGGAGLIGQSFARVIAENGGLAVVADINFEAAKRISLEIERDCSGRIEAAKLDITCKDSINTLISDLKQRHRRIDAVINNAYPRNENYGRRLEDVTYSDFCENVDMHLGGYFLVAQQFCLEFRDQGYGNVINMSSIYGSMAPRFEVYNGTTMTMPVEYAAIKSSIIHLTRYFAQYFKGENIRVNSLSLGGILDIQPEDFLKKYRSFCNAKGMLDPADVTGAMLFLLSDSSKYTTGQNLILDDGFTL